MPNADSAQVKIRKRIWWSLYVRDRQCSASLGLPSRIRDEDCDVAMLGVSDFEEQGSVERPEVFGFGVMEHALYAMEMARLAVFRTSFLPMPARESESADTEFFFLDAPQSARLSLLASRCATPGPRRPNRSGSRKSCGSGATTCRAR